MSVTYNHNRIPDQVDVKCPNCGQQAEFEFAEVRRIKLKTDVEFFKNSNTFEYRQFQDSCGHYWHGALYFAGFHGPPHSAIHELPEGYLPGHWEHSGYLYVDHGLDIGSVRCLNCQLAAKHNLRWPVDAYFSISYKHHVLWAFNRESACDLNNYLQSKCRDVFKYRWRWFLLHVPTVFKTHKARETVSRRILRLLSSAKADIRVALFKSTIRKKSNHSHPKFKRDSVPHNPW
jgi:hypothetical protein